MRRHLLERGFVVRIAIVGVGNVAVRNYAPFLARQADVERGYYNRTPAKARDAAATFGGRAFGSLDGLAAWRPDTALVLTSETVRYEVAMALIERGVPRLLLEKPLTARHGQAHVDEVDFERGRQLLAAAAERWCETAMMFNYRFFEQTIAARRIVQERNFGGLTGFTVMSHYACWCHCIDLLHHFGGACATVAALQGRQTHTGQGIEARDLGVVIHMEQGAIGTLVGTAAMSWQHPLFEITLNFERGRIVMRDLDGAMEVLDRADRLHETRTIVRDRSRWQQYGESFERALDAYLTAVRMSAPPPVPGLAGLRELQVEAAIRRAIATGQAVAVESAFPLQLQSVKVRG